MGSRMWHNYVSFGNHTFFALHLFLFVVTAALFWFLEKRRRVLKEQAGDQRPLIEAECTRYMAPVGEFEQYFEWTTGSFIMVGLIGTIYGFIGAVPEVQTQAYNLETLRQALTTSAFGIFWSVIVMFAVHIHRWVRIAPLNQQLRDRQRGDTELEIVKEAAAEAVAAGAKSAKEGLEIFARAVDEFVIALKALRSDTRSSVEAVNEFAKSSAETLAKADSVLKRSVELPAMVSSQLEATVTRVERLPDYFQITIKKCFEEQVQQLETVSRIYAVSTQEVTGIAVASIEKVNKLLEESMSRLENVPGRLEAFVTRSLRCQTEQLEHVLTTYESAVRKLSDQALCTVEEAQARGAERGYSDSRARRSSGD